MSPAGGAGRTGGDGPGGTGRAGDGAVAGHAGPDSRRRLLVWDAALGFVGFLAALAVLQAVLNVLRPEPAVWPALFALVMVVATWLVWRGRARGRTPQAGAVEVT